MISPALGGFLISHFGFSMIFLVSALIGLFALSLSFFLPSDPSKSQLKDDDEVSLKDFFLIFKEKRLLPIYATIVINMFLVSILFGFLPVYLYGIGYSPFSPG